MANTICLSTDMQTLYLIPNSGTRESLPLSENGANVSLSGGDVAAKRATTAPTGTERKFSLRGQWTVLFDDTAVALEVIGVIDMEVHRTSYSLAGGQDVNIKKTQTDMVVTV